MRGVGGEQQQRVGRVVEEGLSVFHSVGTLHDLLGAAGNNGEISLELCHWGMATTALKACT